MSNPGSGENLRDLGGLEAGGGRLRSGLLFRSGAPRAGVVEAVRARAGRRLAVVDLRTADEVGEVGAASVTGVERYHIPLFDRIDPSWVAPADQSPAAVAGRYLEMLEAGAPSLRAILGLLATTEGATLVHCAAGRDRTGIVIGVTLELLGIDRRLIAEDYARSAGLPDGVSARAETMELFLAGIDARYDSVNALVRGWGVDGDEVERLRVRFVEGRP